MALFQCVILALIVAAYAAPQKPQDVQVLRYDVDKTTPDAYSFAWELSDGTRHSEHGQLKNQGSEKEAIAVDGQYSWVGPDGVTYTVDYTADENGFHPEVQTGPPELISTGIIAALLGKSKK